jgi:uncharacterized protein (DUF885 family)
MLALVARCIGLLGCLLSATMTQAAPLPDFQCALAGQPSEPFVAQAQRFMLTTLALSPVAASQAGYHEHEGVLLDSLLDDFSEPTLTHQREVLLRAQRCFAQTHQPTRKLSAQDAADAAVIRNAIALSLLQLQAVQTYKYRPDFYVELIGSALFFPLTQTNGTQASRLSNAVTRMEQVPRLLQQARQQLVSADPIFISTAVEENAGNRKVIEDIGRMIDSAAPLRARYDAAAPGAVAALDEFSTWLQTEFAKRTDQHGWRVGPKLYAKLFPLIMGTGKQLTPASVLAAAEQDIDDLHQQMLALALPLHQLWFASHGDHAELDAAFKRERIITEVLDRIGDDHTQPQALLSTVQTQAAAIREFIVTHALLSLSSRDNMSIIDTPVFMRGVYKVAGFYAAPPLDPTAEAQYWVTPIAANASPAQTESKLREYNNWMLQYLTIHEALPGHYTQFEHANNIQPVARRLLRVLLGNGPYIEGWGEYGVKEMVDAGYADNDPRFLLMVLKIRLRVAANAILDIRMHTLNMSDVQALELMQRQAFQTEAEAQDKLVRAKLTVGQLPTYYVGFKQWAALRDKYQLATGASFSLKEFNDRALDEGPLPIPILEKLLLGAKAIQ